MPSEQPLLSFERPGKGSTSGPRTDGTWVSKDTIKTQKGFFTVESEAVQEGRSIVFNQALLRDRLSLRFMRAGRKDDQLFLAV